jgi:hypothetical protein
MFDFFASAQRETPRKTKIRFSVLMAVSGLAYLIGGQALSFMHPEIFGSSVVQYVVFLLCSFMAVAVHYSHWLVRHLRYFIYTLLFAGATHLLAVNYLNSLNTQSVLVLCIVMMYGSLFLNKQVEMMVYFGYFLLGLFVVMVNIEMPIREAAISFGMAASIIVANYLFLLARSRFLEYFVNAHGTQSKIFEESYDAILLIDLQQEIIIECNTKALSLLGTSEKNEVIGKSLVEFFDRDFYDIEVEKIFSEVINTSSFTGERAFTNRNGRAFWGDFAAKLIRTNQKSSLFIRIADITRQKKAELEREIEEAKYRTLMEEALDGIFLADFNGCVVDANIRACEMFGYPKAEFVGLDLKKIIDPEDLSKKPLYLSLLIEKKALSFERTFIRKDSSKFIVEVNAKVIEERFIYGIIRDITARKEMELMIVNSEKKYRSLVNQGYDIIVVIDKAFLVRFISESVMHNLGLQPSQILYKSIFDFVSYDYHQELKQMIQLPFSGEVSHTIKEVRIKDTQGAYVYFDAAITNMMHDPLIEGLVLNLHNVTARKNSEDALRKVNFELDNFVYKASHDLRAPLLSILGLLNLSKMDYEGNYKQYLELIERSVLKLDRFLHDLIHYSRNDRRELELSAIDFNRLIEDAETNNRFINQDITHKVRMQVLNQLNKEVVSDSMRLSIILNNLISNSFKYHDPSKEVSYVQVLLKETPTGGVYIEISDNGIGIQEEYLPKVFDMFFRASDQSTGSGLGLYIVKNAVEKLKGHIEVDSQYGKGTNMRVYLPDLTASEQKLEIF